MKTKNKLIAKAPRSATEILLRKGADALAVKDNIKITIIEYIIAMAVMILVIGNRLNIHHLEGKLLLPSEI